MATFAIGDIQGCYDPFMRMLERIAFDPARDQLWITGDLVNRGPRSLEVLRWMVEHDSSVRCVLGNHDLYLLERSVGASKKKSRDTVADVLDAPDRDQLLQWLRSRPLCFRDGRYLIVHAGLLPKWTVEESLARSREVEQVLQSSIAEDFLHSLRGNGSGQSPLDRSELKRLRRTVSVMTRIRTVDGDGDPNFEYDGPLEDAPKGHRAWFQDEQRRSTDVTIIFGHWAALGFRKMANVIALDSGCVWGNLLTAVRLDDGAVYQVPCRP